MLSSIHPLGERSKGNRWGVTTAAHVLGSTLGGALTGLALGTAGWLIAAAGAPEEAMVAAAIGLGGAALLFDVAGDARMRLPRSTRQVNEDWLATYRGWVYGFGFGVQLGAGLTTIVTSACIYLTFALAFLVTDPLAGLAIGTAFGLTRGLVILTGRRLDDAASLRDFHRRLQDYKPAAQAGVVVADVAVVAVLGLALVR